MPKKSSRTKREPVDTSRAFEKAARRSNKSFVLRLFIAGTTPRSTLALANLREICEERLAGLYDLEVIDVYQQPERARDEQIVAVPTLLKVSPAPARRLIGDMSTKDDVLSGLGLMKAQGS